MTSRDLEAAEGVALAKKAIVAMTDGDESTMLALLNTASHERLAWASSYLLGAIRAVAVSFSGQDTERALRVLRTAALNEDEDEIETRIRVIVNEALHDT